MADYKKKYEKYKTKYLNLVKELLHKSIAPHQGNDFFLLTIPEGHPDAGKTVPIDYLFKNIILYFWDKGFITLGSDMGFDSELSPGDTNYKYFIPGFISFSTKMIDGKDSYPVLKKLLEEKIGGKNLGLFKIDTTPVKSVEEFKEKNDERIKKIDQYLISNPKKIVLEQDMNFDQDGYHSIIFGPKYIDTLNKKLNIKKVDIENRLPGSLIPYKPQTKI